MRSSTPSSPAACPRSIACAPSCRARRAPTAGPGALLGRLIGLDAKETQYADGAAFARAVIARVGHKGLNTVWAAPDNLPLPDEIARPEQWIERLGL